MSILEQSAEFEQLLEFLRESRGFDFTGYKRASLMRRTTKRMHEVGVKSYADYLPYLHANPGDDLGEGDVKVAGYALEMTPGEGDPEGSHLFVLDLREVVVTSLHPDGDRIVIESWRPGEPVQRVERT